MAPGSLDYTEGHVYESMQVNDTTVPTDSIAILHRIKGNNLVSQLLMDGLAEFCCNHRIA